MKITVKREKSSEHSTLGEMLVNGEHFCWTLEDVVRNVKVSGETAIPAGIYEITVTHSRRFNRSLPLINNVPGFEGVRIHAGNTVADTGGCILVGLTKSRDFIGTSKIALAKLFLRIQGALHKGEKVMIEIFNKEDVEAA